MHLVRYAGAVGVPVQQIERRWLLAQQIVIHNVIPYQVVGTQQVERPRHLGSLQVTLL